MAGAARGPKQNTQIEHFVGRTEAAGDARDAGRMHGDTSACASWLFCSASLPITREHPVRDGLSTSVYKVLPPTKKAVGCEPVSYRATPRITTLDTYDVRAMYLLCFRTPVLSRCVPTYQQPVCSSRSLLPRDRCCKQSKSRPFEALFLGMESVLFLVQI